MSISVIDYGSGNLKSAAKALEAAANNINVSSKIVVTSDPKTIKKSDILGFYKNSFKFIQKQIENNDNLV